MGGSPKSSIKKRIVRLSIEIQPFIHYIDGLSIIIHPFHPYVHRIVHEINHPAIGDPPFIETPFWGISQIARTRPGKRFVTQSATEQHFDLRAGMSAT
jgi:hypothetical protein